MVICGRLNLKNHRKSIGSIIGGVFILLILLSGYSFYVFSSRSMDNYQRIVTDMKSHDIDRSQERLVFPEEPSYVDDNHLNFLTRNVGPKPVYIRFIGVWNSYNANWVFYPQDEVLLSGEEKNITVYMPGVVENTTGLSNWVWKAHFITEKGSEFPQGYPDSYIRRYWNITDIAYDTIAKIIGDNLPLYRSFSWIDYSEVPKIWIQSYNINKPKADLIFFRINITYYGPGITIGPKTELEMSSLAPGGGGPTSKFDCFIIKATGPYNNETFVAYQPPYITLARGNSIVLYFGTQPNSGGVPNFKFGQGSAGNYQFTLFIFDAFNGTYSQSFPLFLINVDPI